MSGVARFYDVCSLHFMYPSHFTVYFINYLTKRVSYAHSNDECVWILYLEWLSSVNRIYANRICSWQVKIIDNTPISSMFENKSQASAVHNALKWNLNWSDSQIINTFIHRALLCTSVNCIMNVSLWDRAKSCMWQTQNVINVYSAYGQKLWCNGIKLFRNDSQTVQLSIICEAFIVQLCANIN